MLTLAVNLVLPFAQVESYRYLDGMEPLLLRLRDAGYTVHAMSNYPEWYRLIEDKLKVSQYLQWTFVSCTGPMQVSRERVADARWRSGRWVGVCYVGRGPLAFCVQVRVGGASMCTCA
jgi:hypothetical protein